MPKFESFAPNRMCWVDVDCHDMDDALEFYGQLFGWKSTNAPSEEFGGYQSLAMNGDRVAGMSPMAEPGQSAAWKMYVCTDDVDKTVRLAQEAGGQIMFPGGQVAEMGRFAMFADPAGAVTGVWQPMDHTGVEVGNEPGAWMASELNVADVSKVSEFYKQVFDWQVSPWEGADGYYTIMVGDFVAGIMRDMPAVLGDDAQAQWINYFACSNLEQTAAQIESMGGSKGEIEQIPIARKALFRDPQDAIFGLFEMAE